MFELRGHPKLRCHVAKGYIVCIGHNFDASIRLFRWPDIL